MGNNRIIPHSRPTIDVDDIEAVNKIVASGKHADGKTVKKFERAFKEKVGAKYAIATSSGSSALFIALYHHPKNSRVMVPSIGCLALVNAIRLANLIPMVADVHPITLNLLNKPIFELSSNITQDQKIVVFPYMFGNPVGFQTEYDNVKVIEDFAQALGSKRPRKTAIFSFYSNKMIASGYGGMITTNDKKEYSIFKDYLDCDQRKDSKPCFNLKMSDIHATLGLSQLKKLDKFIKKRRKIAEIYSCAFRDNIFDFNPNHVFYRYVIRVKDASSFIKKSHNEGVYCQRPIFRPLHRYFGGTCPVADNVYKEAVSIPIYPSLTEKEICKVIDVVVKLKK